MGLLSNEERTKKLRDALIQVNHHVKMSKIWGGMAWKYHAMPKHRVKRINDIIQTTLDEDDGNGTVE